MSRLQVAHTADLDPATLAEARGLLYEVFGDEMTEDDWEHCLGGVHVIVRDGDEVIGHGAVVQRRLMHRGRALRTGYVEGVAVHAAHRRKGHASAIMAELERIIRGAYDLGALGAEEDAVALYEGRGWRRWEGPTSAMTPNGVVRTHDEDGWIFVLPASAPLDLAAELTCDWREGDAW